MKKITNTYDYFFLEISKLMFECLDKYIEQYSYPKLSAFNDFKNKIQKIFPDQDINSTFKKYSNELANLKTSTTFEGERLTMYFEGLYEIQEILDNWFLKTKGEK